jgi:hypothetical protein
MLKTNTQVITTSEFYLATNRTSSGHKAEISFRDDILLELPLSWRRNAGARMIFISI